MVGIGRVAPLVGIALCILLCRLFRTSTKTACAMWNHQGLTMPFCGLSHLGHESVSIDKR